MVVVAEADATVNELALQRSVVQLGDAPRLGFAEDESSVSGGGVGNVSRLVEVYEDVAQCAAVSAEGSRTPRGGSACGTPRALGPDSSWCPVGGKRSATSVDEVVRPVMVSGGQIVRDRSPRVSRLRMEHDGDVGRVVLPPRESILKRYAALVDAPDEAEMPMVGEFCMFTSEGAAGLEHCARKWTELDCIAGVRDGRRFVGHVFCTHHARELLSECINFNKRGGQYPLYAETRAVEFAHGLVSRRAEAVDLAAAQGREGSERLEAMVRNLQMQLIALGAKAELAEASVNSSVQSQVEVQLRASAALGDAQAQNLTVERCGKSCSRAPDEFAEGRRDLCARGEGRNWGFSKTFIMKILSITFSGVFFLWLVGWFVS